MSGFAGIKVDEAIIVRARRGDADAHESLYRAFAPAVYTLSLRLVKTPALADDMLQETFMEVIRSLPGYRAEASLATWIRRIAVSKCLMHLRSAWHQRAEELGDYGDYGDYGEPAAGRVASADAQGLRMDLAAALASLPAAGRVVVWLHDVEGYTHREIAMLMQKTESYSKSQLSRAHRRLRALLEEETRAERVPAAAPAPEECG